MPINKHYNVVHYSFPNFLVEHTKVFNTPYPIVSTLFLRWMWNVHWVKRFYVKWK